ncbi:hypothetical protein KR084_011061, partial [Drosophila pseudotakahashii]
SAILEILRANLLPEVQHEILYVPITSIAHLRHVVRTRERFFQSVSKLNSPNPRQPPRRQVQEIHGFTESDNELEGDNLDEVELAALDGPCWNCGVPGHRYQECTGARRVFCYGCGKPETYKPNCSNSILSESVPPDLPYSKNLPTHSKFLHQTGQTRKQKRRIAYRKKCKVSRSEILASVIDNSKDYRPFAEVTLLGKTISGLMDTGATINCIGGNFARELDVTNVKLIPVQANVRTADGVNQAIVGRITTSVTFRGET